MHAPASNALDLELDGDEAAFLEGMLNDSNFGDENVHAEYCAGTETNAMPVGEASVPWPGQPAQNHGSVKGPAAKETLPSHQAGNLNQGSYQAPSSTGRGNLVCPPFATEVPFQAPASNTACSTAREELMSSVPDDYWEAESLCKQFNEMAMSQLEASRPRAAHELLSKALAMFEPAGPLASDPADAAPGGQRSKESVQQHRQRLHALSLNNMGCYFRRRGKLEAALLYLSQAQTAEEQEVAAFEKMCDQEDLHKASILDLTVTHLNLCAVYSALDRHEEALEHAETAADMLCEASGVSGDQLEAFGHRVLGGDASALQAAGRLPPKSQESTADTVSHAIHRMGAAMANTIASVYFNMAVELEHLGMNTRALSAFSIAAAVAARSQGKGGNLALTTSKSLQSFRLKMKQLERRRLIPTSARGTSSSSRPSSARSFSSTYSDASSSRQSNHSSAGLDAGSSGRRGARPNSSPSMRPISISSSGSHTSESSARSRNGEKPSSGIPTPSSKPPSRVQSGRSPYLASQPGKH